MRLRLCTEMADLGMVQQKWEAGFPTSEVGTSGVKQVGTWNFIGIDERRAIITDNMTCTGIL
jgi:hypothetical protein